MSRAMRWAKWVGIVVGSIVVALVAALFVGFPRVGPAPALHVERTKETLERGTYIVEHVTVCVDCHSERDFSKFSGPSVPGTFGKGGERFGHDFGLPGELVAPNITPAAIGDWTDGELARAITSGVTPEGRALFPFMNWPGFSSLCKEDLESVIAYVRNLSPIEHEPAKTSLDFPLNLLVRTMPTPAATPERCPDGSDTIARGRYLVTLASCADCHSQHEGPSVVAGREFAGNVPFPLPSGGVVRSANITPDVKTGIGSWTRAQFIERFARFRDPANVPSTTPGSFNTLMPWTMYAGMTDADLGAIYDYLRTVKPVDAPQQQRFAAR